MNFLIVFSLNLLLLIQPANAADEKENPLFAQAFLQTSSLHQQQNTLLTINLQLNKGYHAYVEQFKLTSSQAVNISQLRIDPLVDFKDPVSKKIKNGVEGNSKIQTVIEIPENLPNDTTELDFILTYQACAETYCLFPKKIPLKLAINIIPVDQPSWTEKMEVMLKNSNEKNISFALLIIFLAGFLTSFTPCIFPMIPITLTVLGFNKQKLSSTDNFLKSIFYVLGIAITYSALGVLAAITGKMFGSFLNQPWFLAFTITLYFVMGLGMFGLFEIQVPLWIRQKIEGKTHSSHYLGAFIAGLLAGVLASPCVGPILVSILAFIAKTQNLYLGFIYMFSYALGMGVIFIALGMSTSFLRWLPKSGRWLNLVKHALGVILVLTSLYYANILYSQLTKKTNPTVPMISDNKLEDSHWAAYSEDRIKSAAAAGKPVIIDFFADWCVACKELDQFTFSDPKIQKHIYDYVLLRFDATAESSQLDELKKKYEIYGLPSIIFLNRKGQWQKELTLNSFENAEKFKSRLEKFDVMINKD